MIRHRDSFPARLVHGAAGIFAATCITGTATAATTTAPTDVLIWPQTPTTATAEAEAAVRRNGQHPREFTAVHDRLVRAGQADTAATRTALAAIEQDLAAARQAFLVQRYDDMLAALERSESTAVAALAPGPLCTSTLWEIQLQFGLAFTSRRGPDDEPRARARFALALALDEARRPPTGLYGPDVGLAFARAVDEATRRPSRPLDVAVTPTDARISVDCRPIDPHTGVRPGLHVVRVDAPGFTATSAITSLDERAAIRADLSPGTADNLAVWWIRGELDPASASARAAVHAATGVARVVWLATTDHEHIARLIIDGQPRRIARAATADAAVTQVLAEPTPTPTKPPPRKPRRTALALGITGVVLGGLALGLGLGLGLRDPSPGHLQIFVP